MLLKNGDNLVNEYFKFDLRGRGLEFLLVRVIYVGRGDVERFTVGD